MSHRPRRFMNRDWQYSTTSTPVPNPAAAARGPQLYDNHLYFSFGGVADANENAYLKTICSVWFIFNTHYGPTNVLLVDLTRVEDAAAIANAPLYFGASPWPYNPLSCASRLVRVPRRMVPRHKLRHQRYILA